MHILITSDAIGGVWTYTRELICGLLERGHRVTLVSFGRRPTPSQTRWMAGRQLRFYATDFPLEWMQDARAGVVQSARYLENVISREGPDVLHFNQFCYGSLECGMPKLVVAHSDVLSWWREVHGTPPPDSDWLRWYAGLVSRGMRCADAIVAPSQWMLEAIKQQYGGLPHANVIRNGRNPALFRPVQHKTNSVFSAGRIWDEAKQIKLLLARNHSIPVTIAGSVQHPERAQNAHAFPDGVQVFGEQSEEQMRELYSRASIYVATSGYEPFGLALVEAAFTGCAIIANDLPVFHELWGDSVVYFRHNDADSLAEKIRLLSKNTVLRNIHAAKVRQHAVEHYNSRRMVDEYEVLYKSLISKQKNIVHGAAA